MSHHYTARNVDEITRFLTKDLLRIGSYVHVGRVGRILELRNLCYDIENPRERWLSFKSLKQSRIWAYSEVMTEFLGLNPPLMEFYTLDSKVNKFMRSFHRGDGRANYTYGERWHNHQCFQRIVKRLQDDRYSRQAVMNIYDSSIDLDGEEWNIPCTIMHQFLIRRDNLDNVDRLHLIVYMRSNDLFKGFKYDTFLNSFILEAFAGFLGCDVGTLTFFVGSFHVYEADFSKLEKFVNEEWITPSQYLLKENRPIPFSLGFEELYTQLWSVKFMEEASRHGQCAMHEEVERLHPHFEEWANTYIKWNARYRNEANRHKTS